MKTYWVIARLFAGVMLIIVWGLTDSPLSGVVFILVLTALSAARYRFKGFRRFMVSGAAEIMVCIGFSFLWVPALLGLWFPLIGFLEDKWRESEQELLLKDFEDRAERLRLEKKRRDAELEQKYAAQLAVVNERSRIAQDIHDHVGHEITGALIALQTAEKLRESGVPQKADELIPQAVKRLESASESLRETVHNLKPVKETKPPSLKELCASFEFCRVEYSEQGDFSNFFHSELLAANLKEALTNVSRHSNADCVKVRLDENADYIRLCIHDNGTKQEKNERKKSGAKTGMGLSGMKERVHAAGGTLTLAADDGFKVVCLLPKKQKEDL
ncbi:MAG: sensor histidine kinase [Oscillospiraceae bacterium]|nr:sensor histidine kinase [Oscillospiraceae bacterium]